MKPIQHILYISLLLFGINLFAQDNQNMCECCSYGSLQYVEDYETVFPKKLIASKKIKEVIIYTTGHNRIKKDDLKNANTIVIQKPLTSEYKELKFKFNDDGLVISRTEYILGRPHMKYDFERNNPGLIVKETAYYIDSTEQISTYELGKDIKDYKYDAKGRLIQKKERDYNGTIVPDAQASFMQFEYDVKNRMVKRIRQIYIDFEGSTTHRNITTYRFDNMNYSASYKMNDDGELFATGKMTYTKDWKILSDKSYNNKLKKNSFDIEYEYMEDGRISLFKITAGEGAGSECPDGGSYTDEYIYNDEGLLDGILHHYNNYTCEMRFVYK